MKKTLTALCALSLACAVQAEVSIDPQAGYIYTDAGSSLLPSNSLVAWIADADGDGFGDFSNLSPDSFLADIDDVLLGTGSSGSFAAGTITGTQLWENVTSPNVVGDPFAMLWFDIAYDANATGAGPSVNFGLYNTGEVVPADGTSAANYSWLTGEVGGSLANDSFHSSYTTGIPEPSTLLFGLLGLTAMVCRRRINR